jgi:hypothetical protein
MLHLAGLAAVPAAWKQQQEDTHTRELDKGGLILDSAHHARVSRQQLMQATLNKTAISIQIRRTCQHT